MSNQKTFIAKEQRPRLRTRLATSTVRAAMILIAALFAHGCQKSGDGTAQNSAVDSKSASVEAAAAVRESKSPAGADSREPELFVGADGRVVLSWIEKVSEGRHALRFAVNDGAGWSAPRTVAEGDNWFVNWADFPSVISLPDGSLAAHWLVKSGKGTYAYDVHISRSTDGGATWGKSIVPHTDRTQTEHGFVSLVPLSDGRLGAFWVDGRNMEGMKEEHDEKGPLPVSMTLRYAALDRTGKLSDEAVLDERICECCQTSATLTSDGPVVVYRDRSEQEVRDIHAVRREGAGWSAPRAVHADKWQINGCPVNGPSIAAEGRRIAVAWFTGEGDSPRVQLAFSDDAGTSFGNAVRVDDGEAVGRVDVVMLADGSALVCWMAGGADGGANKVRRVRADGTLGPVSIITKSDISRSSGFPRMARAGDTIHFAWTQFGKPSQVLTATASAAEFK